MLNASVNIFGVLADGYTQYPDDYSQEIYTKFCELAKGESQIVVHRDGDLMYYGYVRKLTPTRHSIGFCVLVNGVMFSSPCALLPIFERAVEMLAVYGNVISMNDKGKIVPQTSSFVSMADEIKLVEQTILDGIDGLSGEVERLPPVDNSKTQWECRRFDTDDKNEEIVEAARRFPYTVIADKGNGGERLNSYQSIVQRLSDEAARANEELAALKEKHGKLKREKTQLRNVIILILIVAVCCVALLVKLEALEQTQGELETEKERSAKLLSDANTKDEQIEALVNVSSTKSRT
ncbi:MAG: hypothetical protein SOY07_08570 [Bacteroidales bacterium]|nr:hypothetical protein [Bacteroidales bacterium]